MRFSSQFSSVAAATPLALAAATNTVSVDDDFSTATVLQSDAPQMAPHGNDDGVPTVYSVPRTEEASWSKSNEREFSKLSALKAVRSATPEQIQRWQILQELRRRSRNPMSTSEIIFQYRRRVYEARILKDLRSYVEFLQTEGRSQT